MSESRTLRGVLERGGSPARIGARVCDDVETPGLADPHTKVRARRRARNDAVAGRTSGMHQMAAPRRHRFRRGRSRGCARRRRVTVAAARSHRSDESHQRQHRESLPSRTRRNVGRHVSETPQPRPTLRRIILILIGY
jgi:hypothetical protein